MMNLTQTNSLISDIEREQVVQFTDSIFIHKEKLNTLFWYKNCGELRTEKEVLNKIKRYEEECLLLNDREMEYRSRQEGIALLKLTLE